MAPAMEEPAMFPVNKPKKLTSSYEIQSFKRRNEEIFTIFKDGELQKWAIVEEM